MKDDNPLDKHLKVVQMTEHLRSAVCEVADVMDLARLITESVFEEKATPELTLAVFDRLASRLQMQSSLYVAPQVQGRKDDV